MYRLLFRFGLVTLLVGCFGSAVAADESADREAAKRKAAAEEEAFKERVNAAIERGVVWLKGQQRKDGSYPGFSEDLKPRQYNIMVWAWTPS